MITMGEVSDLMVKIDKEKKEVVEPAAAAVAIDEAAAQEQADAAKGVSSLMWRHTGLTSAAANHLYWALLCSTIKSGVLHQKSCIASTMHLFDFWCTFEVLLSSIAKGSMPRK